MYMCFARSLILVVVGGERVVLQGGIRLANLS
jgi:hypothetical protein